MVSLIILGSNFALSMWNSRKKMTMGRGLLCKCQETPSHFQSLSTEEVFWLRHENVPQITLEGALLFDFDFFSSSGMGGGTWALSKHNGSRRIFHPQTMVLQSLCRSPIIKMITIHPVWVFLSWYWLYRKRMTMMILATLVLPIAWSIPAPPAHSSVLSNVISNVLSNILSGVLRRASSSSSWRP